MQMRLNSPCTWSDRRFAGSFSPARVTASSMPAAAVAPSGFSMKQLIFASVLSGVIVWGITGWLEGGSK
jgi:hypothetical protein